MFCFIVVNIDQKIIAYKSKDLFGIHVKCCAFIQQLRALKMDQGITCNIKEEVHVAQVVQNCFKLKDLCVFRH